WLLLPPLVRLISTPELPYTRFCRSVFPTAVAPSIWMPTPVFPLMRLPAPTAAPPMVLLDEPMIRMPAWKGRPVPLGKAEVPAAFRPMMLPATVLPLLALKICTPATLLPEIRLPSAASLRPSAFVPIRTPVDEEVSWMPCTLGMADVPAGLVP